MIQIILDKALHFPLSPRSVMLIKTTSNFESKSATVSSPKVRVWWKVSTPRANETEQSSPPHDIMTKAKRALFPSSGQDP